VVQEFSLRTYAQLFTAANMDVILRTAGMAAAVTLLDAEIAFPIAYYAARYARGRWKAAFYLAVMLPLWSSYLVRVYAWKLILAEGILNWRSPRRMAPGLVCRSRWSTAVAIDQLHRHLSLP
jgi:putative spermidine/putrescine transport system permease protein